MVLTVLALVAVTGVLFLSTTSTTDCHETDANEQQKADLLKLSPVSTVSTISLGASCEASRREGTKLEQDNAALRQQLHQLRAKLRTQTKMGGNKNKVVKGTNTDKHTAPKAKPNSNPSDKRSKRARRKAAAGGANGEKKHDWTTIKKEAGTVPPIYHRMHQDTSESMQKSCAKFRERVPLEKRLLGVAGLFNTGTNLLSLLLDKNCKLEAGVRTAWGTRLNKQGGSMGDWGPVLWQVPYGKHNFPTWEGKYISKAMHPFWLKGGNKHRGPMELKDMMAVVLVKDPLTWMGSMCRNRYAAFGGWWHQDNCPSLIQNADVTLKQYPQKGNESQYRTILDFWTEWHSTYFQRDGRIFMRYEDLLFDQANALETVCSCVGGTLANPLRGLADAVKNGTAGHQNGEQVGRDKAVERYSNAKIRLMRYTDKDLNFIRHHKSANEIMDAFGYFVPDVATATTTRGKHEPQRFANGV